jgi:hypothetical protein
VYDYRLLIGLTKYNRARLAGTGEVVPPDFLLPREVEVLGKDYIRREFSGWSIADGSVLNYPPIIGSDYAKLCTQDVG